MIPAAGSPAEGWRARAAHAERFIASWPGAIAVGAVVAALLLTLIRHAFRPDPLADLERFRDNASAFVPPPIDAAMIERVGLGLQLHLLVPADLGVREWRIGDFASYRYTVSGSKERLRLRGRKALLESTLTVTVLDESRAEDVLVARGSSSAGDYWLRWSGLQVYRDQPYDRYALADPADLRPSRAQPMYSLQPGYIPTHDRTTDLAHCEQARLERIGSEECETPAGSFACERFRATIGAATLDVWASAEVRPLGIVRLRSTEGELLLLEHGSDPAPESEPAIQSLLDGVSTFALGCLSCHHDPSDCHTFTLPAR